MVYKMTKAMAANVSDMAASNKSIARLTPKIMAEDIGVPFHKGAVKVLQGSGGDVMRERLHSRSSSRGAASAAPFLHPKSPSRRGVAHVGSNPVISEEVPATPPKTRALKWTVSAIAVAMSLFHMYVAGFGPPEAMIFRGTHLLFALTLVFLLYPLKPGGGIGWRMLDMALLLASWAFILHIFFNYEYITYRTIYIDDLTTFDKVYAVISVLIVLEATRRVLGWALPITAFVFLAYAVFLTNVKLPVLMEQLYLSTEGIFGSTLGVSASYVMLFVLFGAFMERSGTGKLFMDFALAITGHTAGGPGKVSVVSSSLFGTVSGSAVANVMVDGPMTIPLMKRTGFQPAVRRGGRGGRLHRRADHAAGDGRGRIRDGRVPGGELLPGHAVGGDPGDPVLRGGVLRRAFRGQARRPAGRAQVRTAAPRAR